jgi:hypothetical protein
MIGRSGGPVIDIRRPDRMIAQVEALLGPIAALMLYGSHARETAGDESTSLRIHHSRSAAVPYPSRISSARTIACDQAGAPCAVGTASLFRSRAMAYAVLPSVRSRPCAPWRCASVCGCKKF